MALQNFFKNTIIELSKLSKCVSKQVGAILVKDGRIVSTGYNGTLPKTINCCDVKIPIESHHEWSIRNELHAEQNALMIAAKNGISTNGCHLYCTLQPCNTCILLLIQAGISKIFYINKYDRSTYSKELLEYLDINNITVEQI